MVRETLNRWGFLKNELWAPINGNKYKRLYPRFDNAQTGYIRAG
jgi:hypothetical protein